MIGVPNCCGEPMCDYTLGADDGTRRRVWRCMVCGRTRDPYKPWHRWFFLAVRRMDIGYEWRPPWYLGAVGNWPGEWASRVVFALIPFNVCIDLAISVSDWLRFRSPSAFRAELEAAERDGALDGARLERARIASRLRSAGFESDVVASLVAED